MIADKRYLQYNDLVFDGYDMLSNADEQTSFKSNTTSYSYTHGSYAPLKKDYLFVQEKSVSLALTLKLKKVPCEFREYYVRFAEQELVKPGKLWAIKNNEILWAYAYTRNVHQIVSYRNDVVEYDIEFGLPEGVWHKADKQKTFVVPYDPCTMMECKGYRPYDPCESMSGSDDCCEACLTNKYYDDLDERCFCCCVDDLTADMALCYHVKELQRFYTCDVPFQLVYNCEYADKFSRNDYLGQKICTKDACDGVIVGRFYSNTDIPTTEVGIVLTGIMHNPRITINGNANTIKGDYDGTLIIKPSGDVYYTTTECCEGDLLDPSVWSIPSGMDYGWEIHPQYNSIIVELNECCGMSCVYIQHDGLTI